MRKLSIVIPSNRPENWAGIIEDMKTSCSRFSYEIIFVGPNVSTSVNESYVKMVRDFGCPTRCFSIGAMLAEGQYLVCFSDDCRIEPNSFNLAIEFFDSNLSRTDGMTLRYSEGENFSGNQHDDLKYWIARTHDDLKLPGISDQWAIAPTFMYSLDYFNELGGIDNRFEHINMNTHDLAFVVQARGGRIALSPSRVLRFNWTQRTVTDAYRPIFDSFMQNDRPLMQYLYSDPNYARKPRTVKLGDWKRSPTFWPRRNVALHD